MNEDVIHFAHVTPVITGEASSHVSKCTQEAAAAYMHKSELRGQQLAAAKGALELQRQAAEAALHRQAATMHSKLKQQEEAAAEAAGKAQKLLEAATSEPSNSIPKLRQKNGMYNSLSITVACCLRNCLALASIYCK